MPETSRNSANHAYNAPNKQSSQKKLGFLGNSRRKKSTVVIKRILFDSSEGEVLLKSKEVYRVATHLLRRSGGIIAEIQDRSFVFSSILMYDVIYKTVIKPGLDELQKSKLTKMVVERSERPKHFRKHSLINPNPEKSKNPMIIFQTLDDLSDKDRKIQDLRRHITLMVRLQQEPFEQVFETSDMHDREYLVPFANREKADFKKEMIQLRSQLTLRPK